MDGALITSLPASITWVGHASFVLRLGESVAAIINDAFDLDGVPPKDGTTVPGVARVVKAATANQPANRPAP